MPFRNAVLPFRMSKIPLWPLFQTISSFFVFIIFSPIPTVQKVFLFNFPHSTKIWPKQMYRTSQTQNLYSDLLYLATFDSFELTRGH